MKLPPKKVVYQQEIELRLFSPKDGPAIYQGVQASLPELGRFMFWTYFLTDLTQACATYAEFEAQSLRGEDLHFAGFDPGSGEFLLCCSLTPGSRLNPLAFEIGYWVASKHTGKGIGTTVAKMLIALAFRHYQANRVSLVCNPENARSIKVIEKCGFHPEGRLKNYLRQPTELMLSQGYSPVTDALSFSLTDKDIPSLSWFGAFYPKVSVIGFDKG